MMENDSKQIENKIEKATMALLKMRKSIPRLILIAVIFVLAFPYFPLRNGSLVEQYGYANAVALASGIIVMILVWIYYKMERKQSEIAQLEFDLKFQKKLEQRKEV